MASVAKFRNSTVWKVWILFLAEFLGTGTLLFGGCMAALDGFDNITTNVSRGLTFGMIVMMVFITFSATSGAMINPVVSLAAFIYGTLSFPLMLVYTVAQFAGALCGYGLLKAITPAKYYHLALEQGEGHCVTVPHDSLSSGEALAIEILLTGVLVWTNCGVWDPRNSKDSDSVPIKFALLIAGLSIAGGPLTGASMNPARSLAPAVWNRSFDGLWIYFAGPYVGSLLMATIYRYMFWQAANTQSDANPRIACDGPRAKHLP
ncbi:aquaporin [Anopheles darlingi]|uniref:Aquaporin n=2 Tax=Anopheles darlingi TaxID=43151 RepID=W5J8E8_ANODA|nr:aquaporin AQPAn.G-like isoform X1 [Anopheles darlingi]ETN60732.1 aquaporin [Anopheles darlingi]